MKKGQPQTKLSPCAGEGHITPIFKGELKAQKRLTGHYKPHSL